MTIGEAWTYTGHTLDEASTGGGQIIADRQGADSIIPAETGAFTAAEVESRTGIPAATLRQWERRYGLPNPQRSQSGYRLYSPADVASIEFIKARIAEGVSAGRAVDLLRERQESAPEPSEPPLPLARVAELSRDLTNAAIAGDSMRAQQVLAAAHASLPLESVLLSVVQPSLVEIGERWFRGDISVAHEHRATAFLRGRLHALLDLAGHPRVGPTIVVACAPGERHELGSLIVTIFLRRAGLNAHYLGADMPLDDLIRFTKEVHAEALLLSALTEVSLAQLREAAPGLTAAAPFIGYGGQAFNNHPELAASLGGHYMGSDAAGALDKLLTHLAAGRR